MPRSRLARWLCSIPLTGKAALSCLVLAIAVPTVIRAAVNGEVTGCEFTPYLPSVFICAILLNSWQAVAVALASVAIMGGVHEGSNRFLLPCFISAAGVFLIAAAVMIGSAVLIRRVVASKQSRASGGAGIVFSLEKGEVWASWYGQEIPVLLGSERKVAEMMEDFLAQVELGKRLASK